jgi:hypothetical protein
MNSRASSVARHFKAEMPPDWLDRPWENEQQVRMRLRPLEINASVNYARFSINCVRLEKRSQTTSPGTWDRSALAGFPSGLCRLWVNRYRPRFASGRPDVRYAPNSDQNIAAPRLVAMCHVWTAPAVQEESDVLAKRSGAAMYPACFRLEDCLHRDAAALAAGPDVIR